MEKNIGILFSIFFVTFSFAAEFSLWGTHNQASPIYKPGEPIIFTIQLLDGEQPVSNKKLVWTRTGDDGITTKGEGISSTNGIDITASIDIPGFVRLYVTAFDDNGKKIIGLNDKPIFFDGGACVEPNKLQGAPEPKDFDKFWAQQKAILAETPMEVLEMVEVEGTDSIKVFDVKISCAGKMPVSGYLAMPKNAKSGSLGAEVSFNGYGVKGASKNTWAAKNRISFNINAHGIENGKPAEFYKELSKSKLSGYGLNIAKNSNHETVYFKDMFLRAMRALEFVKSLPEWNGKELRSVGGSQGGLQCLAATGLDQDVTYCSAWSPWCCDMVGRVEYKRLVGGWYVKPTPVMGYYDPVNFVKRANPKCELKIIANLGDYVCPPSGVWIAFNNFPGPKTIVVKQGCEHGYSMKNAPTFTIKENY